MAPKFGVWGALQFVAHYQIDLPNSLDVFVERVQTTINDILHSVSNISARVTSDHAVDSASHALSHMSFDPISITIKLGA